LSQATNRRAGVTLIEILIAVSILALLSTGILMAMRIGFNTLDKTDAHLIHNRRVANARRIVENQIAGFIFTNAEFRPQPESVTVVPFREFTSSRMRFVTTYSLAEAWRGRARILVMQVIPGEKNHGVRLIANEIPWTGPAQAGEMVAAITPQGPQFAPLDPDRESFVLADGLDHCSFLFEVQREDGQPGFVWVPEYHGPWLPRGIRIDMAPLEPKTSEMPATSITVSFPISRKQGLAYADAN
jgi:prepilin-type N-terminal cleavage/methylation domain-containing protein